MNLRRHPHTCNYVVCYIDRVSERERETVPKFCSASQDTDGTPIAGESIEAAN